MKKVLLSLFFLLLVSCEETPVTPPVKTYWRATRFDIDRIKSILRDSLKLPPYNANELNQVKKTNYLFTNDLIEEAKYQKLLDTTYRYEKYKGFSVSGLEYINKFDYMWYTSDIAYRIMQIKDDILFTADVLLDTCYYAIAVESEEEQNDVIYIKLWRNK